MKLETILKNIPINTLILITLLVLIVIYILINYYFTIPDLKKELKDKIEGFQDITPCHFFYDKDTCPIARCKFIEVKPINNNDNMFNQLFNGINPSGQSGPSSGPSGPFNSGGQSGPFNSGGPSGSFNSGGPSGSFNSGGPSSGPPGYFNSGGPSSGPPGSYNPGGPSVISIDDSSLCYDNNTPCDEFSNHVSIIEPYSYIS